MMRVGDKPSSPIGSNQAQPRSGHPQKPSNTPTPQSFSQRQQIENNRRVVGSYAQSSVVLQANPVNGVRRFGSEMGYVKKPNPGSQPNSAQRKPQQRPGPSQSRPAAGFREPSGRYNPYA